MSDFWLGPTYEFQSGPWRLIAGIRAEEARLEWLLIENDQEGNELVSHSFVLEQNGTAEELSDVLGDIPDEARSDLVAQVAAQTDPPLVSRAGGTEGIA